MRKRVSVILMIFSFLLLLISCKPLTSTDAAPSPAATTSIFSSSPQDNKVKTDSEIPLRFVVMADSRGSDIGLNTKIVQKTLENIKKLSPQPSFALIPGDLVDGSKSYSDIKVQLTHFKDTITQYYPISFFYPGFGNHEETAGTDGERAFEEVFSEMSANFLEGYHKTVYYFDKDDARFYMLNSNHPGETHTISDKQLDWIKTNSDPKKKFNLYFLHEPAFPTGAHVGSSLDVNKPQRDKFWTVVDTSQGPMVFCGHEHNYTRRHINSDFNETIDNQTFSFTKLVYQVTTGTFGAPVYKEYTDTKDVDVLPIPEYHFAVVDISSNKIHVSVYNLDGKLIDNFQQ